MCKWKRNWALGDWHFETPLIYVQVYNCGDAQEPDWRYMIRLQDYWGDIESRISYKTVYNAKRGAKRRIKKLALGLIDRANLLCRG